MTSTAPTITPASVFKKAGLRETAVLLALAWLVPFAIHLVPWSSGRPLGAYLLPVFWTMLVAVYFYGAVSGLLVGLFAPVLNLAVTGLPVSDYFWKTSAEVAIFGLVMTLVVWRMPRLLVAAPLAYVIAKTVAAAVLTPTALFGHPGAFGDFFAHLATGNLPGLIVLAAINGALVWFYPKTETKPE